MRKPFRALLWLVWAAAGPAGAGGLDQTLQRRAQEALACGEEALDAGDAPGAALELFEQSLELAGQLGDAAAMGAARLRLAWAFLHLGQYAAALDAVRETVALAELAGDRRLEGRAWGSVGDAHFHQFQYAEALAAFRKMLAVKEQLHDERGRAGALKNLGITLRSMGRLDEALQHLRAAEQIDAALGAAEPDVSILHNLGQLYQRLGADDLALVRYRQALEVAERRRKAGEILHLRMTIAELEMRLGFPEAALRDLEPAVALVGGLGGLVLERSMLYDRLGWLHEALGQTQAAMEAYREAIRLGRLLQVDPDLVSRLCDLGGLYLESDPHAAEALFQEALAATEAHRYRKTWWIHSNLARAYRRLGDRPRALEALHKAINELEPHRGEVPTEVDRLRLGAETQRIYLDLIDLLLDPAASRADADGAAAFHVLELARARTLLESLSEAGLDPEPRPDPSLLEREAKLREHLAELRKRLEHQAAGPGAQALRKQLKEAELDLDRLAEALRRKSPGASGLHSRKPLALAQAQSLLDGSTALLLYVLTAERTYALVVRSGGFRAERLPVPARDLAARVENGLELLSGAAPSRWQSVGQRLYRELFEPVRPHLPPQVRRLIIVQDGLLHRLPFEALQDPSGRFLLEDYTISYTPSATVLAELGSTETRSTPAERTAVLAVAYSPPGAPEAAAAVREAYEAQGFELKALPHSAAEALAIEAALGPGSQVHVDTAASEGRLKSLPLERFGVLHFATHALLSERTPQRSALVLAPGPEPTEDGYLQARELSSLRLRAELAVLSACQTARGRVVGGEGVQSLARAFFAAGVRSVVASLWHVEDRSSARFMAAFYRHLAAGRPKAEALRQAKLDFLAEPETAAPGAWAPFILIGEPAGTFALQGPGGWPWTRYGALLGMLGLVGTAALLLARSCFRRGGI
jgi:CHAT domain-containing protein/Tfp pilus assembly protein PilF